MKVQIESVAYIQSEEPLTLARAISMRDLLLVALGSSKKPGEMTLRVGYDHREALIEEARRLRVHGFETEGFAVIYGMSVLFDHRLLSQEWRVEYRETR